jgi:hypothetical protein
MTKAKQIEHLIESLPIPEPEEVQVRARKTPHGRSLRLIPPSPPFFLVRVTQGCTPGDARGGDATGESGLCGGGRPSQCVPYTNVEAGLYLLTDCMRAIRHDITNE